MKENLRQKFTNIFSKYSDNRILENDYWKEIEKKYSKKSRHYHNLSHLENMIYELENIKTEINDWDSLLFSVFYHDIVYKSTAKNNEEKSAELAKLKLQMINLNPNQINKIYNQILATKSHENSKDLDTNILIDADLSILGKSWEKYTEYIKQIRKEYSIYPNLLYNSGRKKVLEHFLNFEEIYKTGFFKERYEKQARENISREIESL